MSSAHELDLGPLTWVKGEIDLALERARVALAEAATAQDRLGRIKFAQTHLHQAHGALSIVGLDGLTQFSEVLDRLLGELAGAQLEYTPALADRISRGIAAIGNYLDELTRGQPDQALRLYGLYAELVKSRGQDTPAPSELFFPDLSLRPAFTTPAQLDDDPRRMRALRGRFERGLLKWFKNGLDPAGPSEMREAVAGIEALQTVPSSRAFWFAAGAFFDALAHQGISPDAPIKRLCGRIDAQMRRVMEGSSIVAERLMRDVLYHIAVASAHSPLIDAVRSTYRLGGLIPSANRPLSDQPLAPLLRSLRDALSDAKESWTQFSKGAAIGLPRFQEHITPLAGKAGALGQPDVVRLLEALSQLAQWLRQDPLNLTEALSMDVATAMLLLDAELETHGQRDAGDPQVSVLLERLAAHRRGERLAPLALSEPDSQVRQLNRQLAHEILASLAEVEQSLDGFFRTPTQSDLLAAVSAPLKQIEGALSVMNEDAAVRLVQDAANRIAALGTQGEHASVAEFEDIAHRLSALGVYVEALQHGPADLERILDPSREDAPATDTIESELAQQKRETAALAAALKENPDDIGLRTELQFNLESLRQDASLAADTELEQQARQALTLLDMGELFRENTPLAPQSESPTLSPEASRLLDASAEQIDAELLAIFIEEALEVRETIGNKLELLELSPHDENLLTTIRRSFHTLKGSGRMVGLKDFGEAAWGMEQTLNHWLRLELPVSRPLLALIRNAHGEFSAWVDQLRDGRGIQRDVSALLAEAERLRSDDTAGATPPAKATPLAPPAPQEQELDLEASMVLPTLELPEAHPTLLNLGMNLEQEEEQDTLEFPELNFTEPPADQPAAEDAAPATSEPPPEPEPLSFELPGDGPDLPELAPLELELREEPLEQPIDIEAIDLEAPAAPSPGTDVPAEGPIDFEIEPEPEPEITLEAPPIISGVPELPEEVREIEIPAPPESIPQPSIEAPPVATIELPPSNDLGSEEVLLEEALDEGIEVIEEAATEAIPPEPEEPDAKANPDEVRIGEVVLSRPLFDLYLAEARQHVATLRHELGRMAVNPSLVPGNAAIRAAHTLSGISGTAHFAAPQTLSKALELAQQRLRDHEHAPSAEQATLLNNAAGALESMLVQLSSRVLPEAQPELADELDRILVSHLAEVIPLRAEVPASAPVPPQETHESPAANPPEASPQTPQLKDELDFDLLPIFIDEGNELLDSLDSALRNWRAQPADTTHAASIARLLHTLKGSARMVGAMGLGQSIHDLETRLDRARNDGSGGASIIDDLVAALDQSRQSIETFQQTARGDTSAAAPAPAAAPTVVALDEGGTDDGAPAPAGEAPSQTARAQLRVDASRLDQFVNEAGEISIARTRIEGELRTLRRSLLDLTENVIRLRNQLREVEIQADTQMQSRLSQVETRHTDFDPLEMDRYTRLQELTRMMAESVGDVTTVQQHLLRNLDGAESALHAQSRMARDLQQSLMHVRMVPFDSQAERLYRLVRQSAKETGRRANLDIVGGQIEMDRSVLDAMSGPLGHLVRNAITHGIESPEARQAAGKPEIGQITLRVAHEGNEVVIDFRDDGAGLDFERIRAQAIESGLIGAEEDVDEKRLTNLIFVPGFTTASLSSLAGRGVGMDVVKSETAAVGGRITVETEAGRGTRFRLHLPLTLAVTQALLVQAGGRTWAIPSSMIAQVLELKAPALEKLRQEGGTHWLGEHYGYRYLPRLLGDTTSQPQVERFNWMLLLRAGSETLALHVDGLRGNQEVVVKNAGPQFARMVGYSGATVLGDGEIILILNPVALAGLSPASSADAALVVPAAAPLPSQPTVMVVDDSLTVRKITGRLLEREGFRVVTAKDGVDALEQLLTVKPDVIIADIEMPRMDGFDLTRNIRADARLKAVPIIMITSRTADKHKRYAEEIGVNAYLGKPYDEEHLLSLIQRFTAQSR